MATPDKVKITPPYISLTTLNNFMEKLGAGVPPPRIDKGYLDKYSGAAQALLLSTLKLMGFIDEASGDVLDALEDAAKSEDRRKGEYRRFAESFYAEQLALAAKNGTSQMLEESFRKWGITGSTMRKAVVFYLHLVEYVGLPNSPHFKPPRQAPGGTKKGGRTAGSGQSNGNTSGQSAQVNTSRSTAGESKTITLGTAGTVTVTVDVRWLDLPMEQFTALRTAIQALESLQTIVESSEDEGAQAVNSS